MLKRLVEVAEAHAVGVPQPLAPSMSSLASTAPKDVASLIELLGTRHVRLDLGWRGIQSRYLGRLYDTWRTVAEDSDAADPREAELASGVQIGASGGGELYFGLCWGPDGISVAEIDVEEAFITWHPSLEAFFERVKEEEEVSGSALAEPLRELLPGTRPSAPPPVPTVHLAVGDLPPHPHAEAQAHFGHEKGVFQVGPSRAGRLLLGSRLTVGADPTVAALAVRESDVTTRALSWPAAEDIYGACLVPGQERALLCVGAPGPLLELDLVTGALHTRLPFVRWSCGFVDAEHVVVHEDGEARVYEYADELRLVASATVETHNLFVGHGRVFTLPTGPVGVLQVHRWERGVLVPELRAPIAPRVFHLNAAAVHAGRRLVASVDWHGHVSWFDLGGV